MLEEFLEDGLIALLMKQEALLEKVLLVLFKHVVEIYHHPMIRESQLFSLLTIVTVTVELRKTSFLPFIKHVVVVIRQ